MRSNCGFCHESFLEENLEDCQCGGSYCFRCISLHTANTGHKTVRQVEAELTDLTQFYDQDFTESLADSIRQFEQIEQIETRIEKRQIETSVQFKQVPIAQHAFRFTLTHIEFDKIKNQQGEGFEPHAYYSKQIVKKVESCLAEYGPALLFLAADFERINQLALNTSDISVFNATPSNSVIASKVSVAITPQCELDFNFSLLFDDIFKATKSERFEDNLNYFQSHLTTEVRRYVCKNYSLFFMESFTTNNFQSWKNSPTGIDVAFLENNKRYNYSIRCFIRPFFTQADCRLIDEVIASFPEIVRSKTEIIENNLKTVCHVALQVPIKNREIDHQFHTRTFLRLALNKYTADLMIRQYIRDFLGGIIYRLERPDMTGNEQLLLDRIDDDVLLNIEAVVSCKTYYDFNRSYFPNAQLTSKIKYVNQFGESRFTQLKNEFDYFKRMMEHEDGFETYTRRMIDKVNNLLSDEHSNE